MSIIASRVGLRQRCTIERDAATSSGSSWGNSDTPAWETHLTDVPCRSWVTAGKEPIDPDRAVVVVDRRILVPLGTDVTEQDRVASVTERGEEFLDGPMEIEAVLRRRSHLELAVRRVR